MQDESDRPAAQPWRWLAIGAVVVFSIALFAYVGGWLTPGRLTPSGIVDQFEANAGTFPGYRRNHAKGVCVVGYFQSNGHARTYSRAQVFEADRTTPVVGRFAIPGPNPYAPDASVPVRSMALRFLQANGQQWRTGMNNMPVFSVSTPQGFLDMLKAKQPDPATGKPDPQRVAAFFAAHPETAAFRAWAKSAQPSTSFATEHYYGLDAFLFVNAKGQKQPVRWAMVPDADRDVADGAASTGKIDLEAELRQRLSLAPLRWHLQITLAQPADPTDDATKAWPANRSRIDAGTLVLTATRPQSSGPCRDINYDPTVLPNGIAISDDPLLPARSAAYANSYLRRTSEEAGFPGTQTPRRDAETEDKS